MYFLQASTPVRIPLNFYPDSSFFGDRSSLSIERVLVFLVCLSFCNGCSSVDRSVSHTEQTSNRTIDPEIPVNTSAAITLENFTDSESRALLHDLRGLATGPLSTEKSLYQEEAEWLKHRPIERERVDDHVIPKRLFTVNAVLIPVHNLLYSLAEEAGLDLMFSGDNPSTITLRASSQSLESILDSVAQQANLRWNRQSNLLQILPDEPYLGTYDVEYLNISRQAQSSVGLATQVGSIALDAAGSNANSNFSNNSQSLIENTSEHHFWESLKQDLQYFLESSSGSVVSGAESVAVNRDTGLVSVYALQRQQRVIEQYLQELQSIASRQVLIEATIVEIALSDSFQAGVNWRAIPGGDTGIAAAQVLHGSADVSANSAGKLPVPTALLSAIHQSNSLGRIAATLDLLKEFGQVKILSRPQIIAINNQSAVLKVVDNRVYFTMSVEKQTSDGTENSRTATDIHTVPVGLVMSVTPYVAKDNSVILSVRPTISRILGFVNDPNPELAEANVQNGVPEIQVREMESVLRVGDRQIVMIGGLMQSQSSNNDAAVPWLSDVPILGKIFKNKRKSTRKTELLVFLQPTVMSRKTD